MFRIAHLRFTRQRADVVDALQQDQKARARLRQDVAVEPGQRIGAKRSEEHTSELQSLMRISYAVFCLKKKKTAPHNERPSIDDLKYTTNTDGDRTRMNQTTSHN